MTVLEGRVAIVTGAGRGLGRAHALALAEAGARVVVNDAALDVDGRPGAGDPAAEVAAEIRARGGEAVANRDDVSDWDGGRRVIDAALQSFGTLHVLVNNAGILRDRALVNLSEDDWDTVMRVDLKGHFVPTRFAASYWREQAHAGASLRPAIVNTTSTSGLQGNPGQAHYGTAKAGVAAFTIICAQELARYDVRVNAVSPAARTRMTDTLASLSELFKPPVDADTFDVWDPANVSPLVTYLASTTCAITGEVFQVQGGRIRRYVPWTLGEAVEQPGRWTPEEIGDALARLVGTPSEP